MVKNSKNSTKNMMCILLVILIIVIIVSLLYLFYKKNKSYERFISNSSKVHSTTNTKNNSIPHLKGTYSKTCNNVKYTDNTHSMISASCRNKKGKSSTSTLSATCNDKNGISNCDGKLKCGKC